MRCTRSADENSARARAHARHQTLPRNALLIKIIVALPFPEPFSQLTAHSAVPPTAAAVTSRKSGVAESCQLFVAFRFHTHISFLCCSPRDGLFFFFFVHIYIFSSRPSFSLGVSNNKYIISRWFHRPLRSFVLRHPCLRVYRCLLAVNDFEDKIKTPLPNVPWNRVAVRVIHTVRPLYVSRVPRARHVKYLIARSTRDILFCANCLRRAARTSPVDEGHGRT